MKKIYLLYSILTFMAVAIISFMIASRLVAYFQTVEETPAQLVIDRNIENFHVPEYSWRVLSNDGRKIEPHHLKKITEDYLASNYYYDVYNATGNSIGLKDYYTERMRKKLVDFSTLNKSTGTQNRITTLSHDLDLKLYSEDGTIAVLTDKQVRYIQLYEKDMFNTSLYDTARFDVMLLLEDNFWRTRHKIRKVDQERKQQVIATENNQKVKIKGKQFIVDNKPFISKGINYYTAESPWEDFWPNFDEKVIKNDFKTIKSLGFNTVRIFIPYHQFGENKVQSEYLSKLICLLDLAETEDLKVIITLFDFFLQYQAENWTFADRHVEMITRGVNGHPAIFSWDIKNEPNLDFESQGEDIVKEWLKFIAGRIRHYTQSELVTIGWSSPLYITTLHDDVDYYSFHYYERAEDLAGYLDSNFDKPILLEETGMHSFNAWWYPFRKSQHDQATYIKEVLAIIKKNNLSYSLWTLYDFKNIPDNVVGTVYWRKGIQKNFGIIDKKGKTKSGYEVIKAFNRTYNPGHD